VRSQNRKSKIENRKSKIENRKSKIENRPCHPGSGIRASGKDAKQRRFLRRADGRLQSAEKKRVTI